MKRVNMLHLAAMICLFSFSTMACAQETGIGSREQPAFDMTRFRPTPSDRFETFHVADTEPLHEALQTGTLQEDTPVLLTDTAAGRLALLMDQMAYHHIAQGRAGDKDWMATF